jgi:hypothetical protein
VRPGEDFVTIAKLYYGTPGLHRALWAANRKVVPHPNALRAGQTIMVPPAGALDPADGEMPTPLTDRERAETPAPRQAKPKVARPSKPRFERLRRLWNDDSTSDPANDAPRPPFARVSGVSDLGPKLDPAVGRAAAVTVVPAPPPPHDGPRHYRPGDLTRVLLTRLTREDGGVSDEDAGDMPTRLQRPAPATPISLTAARLTDSPGALRMQSPVAESLLPTREQQAPLRSWFAGSPAGR